MVEFSVEHADDIGGLVADDCFLFLVVESGHSETAVVVRVDLEVDLAEVGVFWMQGVFGHVFAGAVLVIFNETPA